MARNVRTSSGGSGGLSLDDVKKAGDWEFLGYDSTPSGVAIYSTNFDRNTYLGYRLILIGSGSYGSATSLNVRLTTSAGDTTQSGYGFTYQQPNYYGYSGTYNSQPYIYTPNNPFWAYTTGHNTITTTVLLATPTQTNLDINLSATGGSGTPAYNLWGNFYSTSEVPAGIKFSTSGNLCVGGGVYRFGMRRRS